MPFINRKFYMNPAYGRALERARANDLTKQNESHRHSRWSDLVHYYDDPTAEIEFLSSRPGQNLAHQDSRQYSDAHWVTIDGRHVLIQEERESKSSRDKHSYFNASNGEQRQNKLSDKSKAAINKAMGNDSGKALLWQYAILHAAAKNGMDPNLLVGLASRESGLNPSKVHGEAQGMFQIVPKRQVDLGLSNHDLFNANVVTNAVAGSLARATKAFNGNSDLAIASWTAGVAGTKAAFSRDGMQGVRNLLLDRANPPYGKVGPNYVDVIKSFQVKRP